MQRQGALADATLAGADGHEMTHPGEPVSDAGALLGNLLEDPGPSVADDVVVALHLLTGGLRPPNPLTRFRLRAKRYGETRRVAYTVSDLFAGSRPNVAVRTDNCADDRRSDRGILPRREHRLRSRNLWRGIVLT